MNKVNLPFWLNGSGNKADARGFSAFISAWWAKCEAWLSWPLNILAVENAPLFMVDLLADERDVQRFAGEPEELYRLRVKYAYANVKDAGTVAGFKAIWQRLGLGDVEVSERVDSWDWDIVLLTVEAQQIADNAELMNLLIEKYGRTCRRYYLGTKADAQIGVSMSAFDFCTTVNFAESVYEIPEIRPELVLTFLNHGDHGIYADTGQLLQIESASIETNSRPFGTGFNLRENVTVSIPNTGKQFEMNSPCTVEMWCARTGGGNDRRGIISTWPDWGVSTRNGWSLFEYYGNIAFGLYEEGGGTICVITFPASLLPDNEWKHIALVRGDDYLSVYIGGVLVSTGRFSKTDFIYTNERPLTLNHWYSSQANFLFDEVRVTKTVLYNSNFIPDNTFR